MRNSIIRGVGRSAPERVVANSHFESYLETSDEWIQERSGIETRYWVEPGTSASDLALPAAKRALEMAGVSPKDVDAIVLATVPRTTYSLQQRRFFRASSVLRALPLI